MVLSTGSEGSTIKGLVIQGFSDGAGIFVESNGNTIQANCLGTDSGCNDSGGNRVGVEISNADDNIIGGARTTVNTCDGDCNTIGSNFLGVVISGTLSSGNIVTGNFIGYRIDGANTIGNTRDGVYINDAPNSTVGGPNAGEDNVIVGNGGNGIYVLGGTTVGTKIVGNRIGNEPTESSDVQNATVGILVQNAGAVGSTIDIGGPNSGEGNVITGNGRGGIAIDRSIGVRIRGNRIGTNKAGTG